MHNSRKFCRQISAKLPTKGHVSFAKGTVPGNIVMNQYYSSEYFEPNAAGLAHSIESQIKLHPLSIGSSSSYVFNAQIEFYLSSYAIDFFLISLRYLAVSILVQIFSHHLS